MLNPLSFELVLQSLSQQNVPLTQVLWVLPRIETAAAFKHSWAKFHGQAAVLSPMIQTADRLSMSRAQVPWFSILADLVGLLSTTEVLTAGMSSQQVWALAQEYLELAFRLVLIKNARTPTLDDYLASNHFAQVEANVVVEIARVYQSRLESLVCQPHASWFKQDIERVVWFNDGEVTPKFWLQSFLPDVPVLEYLLPCIEGAQPWRGLLSQRLSRQRVGICLQIAPDETVHAQQAAACVLDWLKQDAEQPITIAVLDRLAARRLVDLLAEQRVLVDDRTGWRFSTSKVSGWFYQVVLAYAAGLELQALPTPFTGVLLSLSAPWGVGENHTLMKWGACFHDLLQRLGFVALLLEDEAGRLLLEGLSQLQRLDAQAEFSALEFVAAWSHWAESQRFRPQDVLSPVRIVPLLTTRLRQFERVLVLGCAQSHFQESPPGLLPPAVALEFALSGPRLVRSQKISALYDLLNGSDDVVLLHCAQVAGKAEILLPELQWFDILIQEQSNLLAAQWRHVLPDLLVAVHAANSPPLLIKPLEGGNSLPHELRVTALDDWAACPLRFGLTHCLPWKNEQARAAPRFEQLRGTFVHRVLEKAANHMRLAYPHGANLEQWKAVLHTQADAVWQANSTEAQAVLYPFVRFFEQIVPRLAGQLIQRQTDGWLFYQAEVTVDSTLTLMPSGKSIHLKGRVDRIDQKEGELSIVDIKFQSASVLKKKLKEPLSVPQLPAYQMMQGRPDAELTFLGIHKDAVQWVPFPDAPEESSWGEVLFQQLSLELDTFFFKNEAWKAVPGDACTYCAAFGVCRPSAEHELIEEDQDEEGV